MNILLIEQDCFKRPSDKLLHVGAHSLHVAEYITKSQENGIIPVKTGKVYVLAKRGSLYEKVALSKGLHVISMPEGSFSKIKYFFLMRRYKINLVHTFDVESAKFLHSLRFFVRKMPHVHSENRYLEEKDVFFTPVFKNTLGYLFADKVFKDYYGVCFGHNKSSVVPITLAPEKVANVLTQDNADGKEAESVEVPLASYNNPSSLFPVTQQDKVDISDDKKKVRFLIPAPLSTKGRYKDILEILKSFDKKKGAEYAWEALFLGLGDGIKEMIELAEETDIHKHLLIFTGIENQDFFDSGDVCIVPVNTDEYVLTALLRAWKYKVPAVINTAIPYCNLAKDNRSVIVSDFSNADVFIDALENILTDNELRERLISSGSSCLDAVCEAEIDYFAFYKKTLQNKST